MTTTYKDLQPPWSASRWLASCLVLLILAACGGGGGGTGGGFQAPDPIRLSVTMSPTQALPANFGERLPGLSSPFTAQVNIQVLTNNGAPAPDGTVVNMTTSNVSIASVSSLDDPETDDVDEFRGLFGQINGQTVGGLATFFVTSGMTQGTVQLIASATDLNSTATISTTTTVTVAAGSDQGRLTIEGTRSSLPANSDGVPAFIGSPFISELTLRMRNSDGEFITPDGGSFGVAIAPVSVAAFSTLDDPATTDMNEFFNLLGNGPVDAAGGQATIFVHAGGSPGTATVTVTANDPQTGEAFSQQFTVTIVENAATGLPAAVVTGQSAAPVFIQGSGGNSAKDVSATVTDGGSEPVPDPVSGAARFNNVRFTLTPPSNNGSRLSGLNANGSVVSGMEISVATTNGTAQISFNAGTGVGTHQVTATVDRADNNVDNGLQDPLSASETIAVGDGQLFDVSVAGDVGGIIINRVTNMIDPEEVIDEDPATGLLIPPDPDSTYSVILSVTGTDQIGGPVLAGTVIQLGKVDAPLAADNASLFTFSGVDGNPAEGSTLFTVVDIVDGFLDGPDIDEAVEIGDTLITFGDEVAGNRELEAARFVASINTNTSLRVTQAFNDNNGAGVMVDDGAQIPYVIGRSTVGSVPNAVQLEADSVGEFIITYPTSAVGRPLALWAQGNRDDNGAVQTVADAVLLSFPGVAPARLTVIPNTIRGNTSVPITVCINDALTVPIQNVPITFSTSGQGSFMVSDDPLVTGSNGCVDTTATSAGLTVGQEPLMVTFAGAGATGVLSVVPPTTAFISASPSLVVLTATAPRAVVVSVVDENDAPVPNLAIMATCDAPVMPTPAQSNTDADGEAIFTLTTTAVPMLPDPTVTGTCTFTATVGSGMVSTTIGYSIPAVPPSP